VGLGRACGQTVGWEVDPKNQFLAIHRKEKARKAKS